MWSAGHLDQKKKNCCGCPQVEFLNIWVGLSENNFFNHLFFLKHPKVQHLGAFSTFFLKKKKKVKKKKKTPNLTKIVCIPGPNLFEFYFLAMSGLVTEGNTTFFFLALSRNPTQFWRKHIRVLYIVQKCIMKISSGFMFVYHCNLVK